MLFNDPKSLKRLLLSLLFLDVVFIALSVIYIKIEIDSIGYSLFPSTNLIIGLSIGVVLGIVSYVIGLVSKKIKTINQYESLVVFVMLLPSLFLYRVLDNGAAMIGCVVAGCTVLALLLLFQYIQIKKETDLN